MEAFQRRGGRPGACGNSCTYARQGGAHPGRGGRSSGGWPGNCRGGSDEDAERNEGTPCGAGGRYSGERKRQRGGGRGARRHRSRTGAIIERVMLTAVCPDCNGTGWKIVERDEVSGASRCACVAVERAGRVLAQCD